MQNFSKIVSNNFRENKYQRLYFEYEEMEISGFNHLLAKNFNIAQMK